GARRPEPRRKLEHPFVRRRLESRTAALLVVTAATPALARSLGRGLGSIHQGTRRATRRLCSRCCRSRSELVSTDRSDLPCTAARRPADREARGAATSRSNRLDSGHAGWSQEAPLRRPDQKRRSRARLYARPAP